MAANIARPEFLTRRQVLYLDAIERSFWMASLAYQRLQESLDARSSSLGDTPETTSDEATRLGAAILLDTWSLVDVLNRLRVMADSMPGLKKSSPGVKSFLQSVAPIEDLRNAVQHLYGETIALAETGYPIWGSLSWASPHIESGNVAVGLFVPGTLALAEGIPLVNPLGRHCELPVGLIELSAAGRTVSLSDMVAAARRFEDRLGRAAGVAFANSPTQAGNVVLHVDA